MPFPTKICTQFQPMTCLECTSTVLPLHWLIYRRCLYILYYHSSTNQTVRQTYIKKIIKVLRNFRLNLSFNFFDASFYNFHFIPNRLRYQYSKNYGNRTMVSYNKLFTIILYKSICWKWIFLLLIDLLLFLNCNLTVTGINMPIDRTILSYSKQRKAKGLEY